MVISPTYAESQCTQDSPVAFVEITLVGDRIDSNDEIEAKIEGGSPFNLRYSDKYWRSEIKPSKLLRNLQIFPDGHIANQEGITELDSSNGKCIGYMSFRVHKVWKAKIEWQPRIILQVDMDIVGDTYGEEDYSKKYEGSEPFPTPTLAWDATVDLYIHVNDDDIFEYRLEANLLGELGEIIFPKDSIGKKISGKITDQNNNNRPTTPSKLFNIIKVDTEIWIDKLVIKSVKAP